MAAAYRSAVGEAWMVELNRGYYVLIDNIGFWLGWSLTSRKSY